MSGQKRPADPCGSSFSGAPPEKRREREGEDGGPGVSAAAGGSTAVETVIKLGGVSNSEEQDIKALQAKNRKLGEALDQRQVIEDELRERIERLETRQATDDASLLILNRYWNQFDDNIRLSVRRYDGTNGEPEKSPSGEGRSLKPETPEPDGDSNQERAKDRGHQGETSNSFLATLASSTSEEMEAELQERVEKSQKQASHVVEIYKRLKSSVDQLKAELDSGDDGSLKQVTSKLNSLLTRENELLQQLTEDLKQKHSHMTSESRSLGRAANKADQRVGELQVRIEELQWDMEKIRRRENRLNAHLSEVLERVNSKGYKVCGEASSVCGTITINKRKFEDMNSELEENTELAENRSVELQKLQQDLQNVQQENNNMKTELLSRAEGFVKETSEYRCLQSQFSVLYNESLILKAQLDETRARLNTTRTARLRQLDHMENDEVALQRKVRTEVFQLEDTLAQVKKEYEMLRIEFEQTLAANEQAGPINREMRHLISTLQTHNQQLKGEVVKYKLRLREAQSELNQLRASKGSAILQSQSSTEMDVKEETTSPSTAAVSAEPAVKTELDNDSAPGGTSVLVKMESGVEPEVNVKEEEEKKEKEEKKEVIVKKEEKEREREKEKEKNRERPTRSSSSSIVMKEEKEKPGSSSQPEEVSGDRLAVVGGSKRKEVEQLKIVRAELKKAQESQKEMKLLLDMYKSAPKEQRDKVQLMAAERKSKAEVEDLRMRVRELEERERKESKKLADEDALRKIRVAEETIEHLQKKLAATKQEEEALLSEMDVTGQAFEDMQEQNSRLLQQLREKDDANFKLMSERIKSNQIYKLLKEEKEELADQVLTFKTQVDAQLLVVQKLEEKEGVLQSTLAALEKELAVRTQALELNKRKAVEAAQLAEDLKVQLEHTQGKLKEIQVSVAENRTARERESSNLKRAQEDLSRLRRKLEKQKKVEVYSDADEILQEEINQYKAKLRCPCCNTRDKETVLTKCFHVFCYECLKMRYDTRQRKCPKCNCAFGANDFHRIYIT
uniref:E3 ubiquitin protein ligase n=1 Tax=Nothobranchius kadleci TaxID=1051664 RepID=A0A1A8EBM6_NOTKA